MAMFLNGLEETPYTGWTFSGMASCGHRLFLSGGGLALECNDATGWTGGHGSGYFGRLRYTATGIDAYTFTPGSAYFDIRIDADGQGTFTQNQVTVLFPASKYIYAQWQLGTNTRFTHTGGVNNWTGGYGPATTPASIRISNLGDSYLVYFLDPTTNTWTVCNSGTPVTGLAYGTANGMQLALTTTGLLYYDNIRNVVPTVTSGTATSPVLDTVDGFRGLGWITDAGQAGITGTVTVQYKTSADNVTWTGWTTATAWAPIMPSASNRYVQVQVSITGGSTTSASPEVGPILVNGSLDQTSSTILFKRHAASLMMHSSSSYFLGFTQVPSSALSWWNRSGLGVGRWLGVNGDTFSWHGTTQDAQSNTLAKAYVAGMDASVTANGGSQQQQVESANYGLPGVWEARSVLLPSSSQLITTAQKQTWTKKTNDWISSYNSTNWRSFGAVNRQCLKALHAYDALATTDTWTESTTAASSSSVWADSDSNGEISGIAAAMAPEGALNDDGGHRGDIYTSVMIANLSEVLRINPTFDSGGGYNAAMINGWQQSLVRNSSDMPDTAGNLARVGRSLNSHSPCETARAAILTSELLGSGYGIAREIATRTTWDYLRCKWYPGFDISPVAANILSPAGTTLTTSTVEVECPQWVSYFGLCATAPTSFFSAAPYGILTDVSAAHPGWGVAIARGDDSTYPQVSSAVAIYDNGAAGASYFPGYQTGRVIADGFGSNVGVNNTYQPSQQASGFYWVDSSQASGSNLTILVDSSTSTAWQCGKAAVSYRTGTPRYYTSSSGYNSDTGATQSEIYWLRGRHVVCCAKLSTVDTRTANNFGFASPPVPLASGASLQNTAATTTTAYGEGAVEAQQRSSILSVFCQGLTANMQGSGVPRVGTAFIAAQANQLNRDWYAGSGVDCTSTTATAANVTPIYAVVDFAFAYGSMTAATEAGRISSFSQVGDVNTFNFGNADGTTDNVYLAFAGQTNPTVGAYAVTGTIKAFSGESAAAKWWGCDSCTLVKFSGVNQAALASAGNLSLNKLSTTMTRVKTAGSNTTLYAAALPSGTWTVYARSWDGTTVDVTSSCTVTAGTSVVIPSSVVSSYAYGGLAVFDITGTSGGGGTNTDIPVIIMAGRAV
jgi:hypothetical protein